MYSIFLKRAVLALSPAVLLSACVSQSKYDALQSQNQQLQQQVASLDEQLDRLQNAIRFTVNSDLLFTSGSWQLSDPGKSLMARIASQLAPFQTRRIVINGYTDNQPVGSQLRKQGVGSNEILSQRRAQSVMEFLKTQGVKSEFMEAKGWGESNPVAPNNTPAGRAENRRVEITFATATS
jgi:chemotaxis protein MotB